MTDSGGRTYFRTARVGTCLYVSGEVDQGAAPQFAAALTDPAVQTVDLAGVTFIDSSGLRVLIEAKTQRHPAAKPLTIHQPSPVVQRLFKLAGMELLLLGDPAPHPADRPAGSY